MTTLYYFPDQNIKDCPNKHFTRRWTVFQKSLASILKVAIVWFDPHGEVVSLQEPPDPAGHLRQTGAAEAYREIFRRISREHRDLSGIKTVDPLGFPISLIRLDDGGYLLMGEPFRSGALGAVPVPPAKMRAAEVSAPEYGRLPQPVLTPEVIEERLSHTAGLFNKLRRYFVRPNLPELLSAVGRLEQLIISVCGQGYFNSRAVFELITSCLMLIAGSGCAFTFIYEYQGQIATLCCGEQPELVQGLADEWNRLGQERDPGKRFADLISRRAEDKLKTAVEGILYQNNGASVYLGLVGAEGAHLREALGALVDCAAAALELSSFWAGCQESWKKVFGAIRQGIIVVDNRGAILIMNSAAKKLCKERGIAPALGRPVKGCRLGPQIEEALLGAAGSGCSFRSKRSSFDESGAPLCLCWDVFPLLRDDGQSNGAVLVYEDITVTVQLKEEIRKWERLATAGEIAASLAHEVRNPLATAKAAIQLLRMDKAPLKREELLEKLDLELDRTNSILTNFLNISKPMQDEKLEPVLLKETLQELLFFLNGEAVLNEIDLVVRIPPEELPAVLGSANSIKQVCLNIALNAIEAMSGGGRLTISLFQRKKRVHIRFEDNGPGIPAENLEALTRPFFTTKPGGTGLGLAISTAILKSMGGNLNIESNVGEGTAVELSLPIADQ
ncbi:MAG: hypothetical protein GX883_03965 [Firmicutes bacterium]|nr:hypothetical protein [Bacillota bacterium]